MNAKPSSLDRSASSDYDSHGYEAFELGSFSFRRDEYFAHIGWKSRDGRPMSHT